MLIKLEEVVVGVTTELVVATTSAAIVKVPAALTADLFIAKGMSLVQTTYTL